MEYIKEMCPTCGGLKTTYTHDSLVYLSCPKCNPSNEEKINHPNHYGGKDNPYEAIKVIEAWGLGFNLGNTIKYISRAGKKGSKKEDLQKAKWYLEREISNAKD